MRIEPYEMNVYINSYQTDTLARLNFFSLFQLFQEAAYRHAEVLGWGRDFLHSHNLFWALTRAVLEIDRLPLWNETLTIKTAPREGEGLMVPRDLVLIDKQGKTCIKCTTYWIILDISTRKPLMPGELFSDLDFSEDCRLCCLPFSKMRGEFNGDPLYGKVISYSDLDMNNHVNNASYVKFLLDGLSQVENEKEIKSLQIAYHQEAAFGDFLSVTRGQDSKGNPMLKAMLGEKESATARITLGDRSPRDIS